MYSRKRVLIVDLAVVGIIAWFVGKAVVNHSPAPEPDPFVQNVDLEPLRNIAVHDVGRIKSFDSFARNTVRTIGGGRGIKGQDPVFSYMDLMLRPDKYVHEDIIYVKSAIRPHMARVLEQMNVEPERVKHFLKNGKIAESLIRTRAMIDLLRRLDADVIRTSKFVNMIEAALGSADPHFLSQRLTVIPPPGGNEKASWLPGQMVWGMNFLHDGHDHADTRGAIKGLPDELAGALTSDWNTIAQGWRDQDAEAVSQAVASLAANLAKVEPSLYPAPDKLSLESWYFRMGAFVWNWIIYLAAMVPLLLWVVYRWKRAFALGVGILLIAFGIHTASLAIRWYLAGRIPNSNMFEAILAATWFGVVGAFVMEFFVRKTAMRGLFFLGSAVCAMVAMMCQHFMPTDLSSDIENVMPVLDDVWLYIHTNVIIWSYALIGMAAVTALLYLRYRLGGGDPSVAKAGGAGSLILDSAPGKKRDSFLREDPATVGQVLDASTMMLMELAFIMLWAGLVMGAIWADHSWGRPWGWDPKEVFALCTFVIFLILVHIRFKVRDKGLWTAILAVIGCAVMLFNWIVINFHIQGLHSYA